jgi:hypothetical protein
MSYERYGLSLVAGKCRLPAAGFHWLGGDYSTSGMAWWRPDCPRGNRNTIKLTRGTAMFEKARNYDVIADFWKWHQGRQERQSNPLANHALDKCEEALIRCEWDSFGYWHKIYLRERSKHRALSRRRL